MDIVFPGLRGMENIHPVVVHFPIALLLLALLFQVVAVAGKREEEQRVAFWLLWLGTLGALAAAATGLLAEGEVEHPEAAHQVLELHETLMLTTTGLAVLLSLVALVRRRRLTRRGQIFMLVGLLLLCGVLAVGADRGGQLVFQYGVAVQKPAVAPASGDGPVPTPVPIPEDKHDHEH